DSVPLSVLPPQLRLRRLGSRTSAECAEALPGYSVRRQRTELASIGCQLACVFTSCNPLAADHYKQQSTGIANRLTSASHRFFERFWRISATRGDNSQPAAAVRQNL